MARRRQQDEHPVPGGAFIMDAEQREDEGDLDEDGTPKVKHFGGRIVNAQGETLKSFSPDEENPGHHHFEGVKSAPVPESERDEDDEPAGAEAPHRKPGRKKAGH